LTQTADVFKEKFTLSNKISLTVCLE